MNHLDTDSIAARFKARMQSTAAVAITSYQPINPTLARVVVTHANLERVGKTEIRQAIASALGNKARPVEHSFRSVATAGVASAVGFIKLNHESQPYDEKRVSKMRVLSKNMLMDEQDDSLWNIRTTADGQRLLCRQVKEDVSELLVTASVHVHRAPAIESIASVAFVHDLISFVDPKTETVRVGVVLAAEQLEVDGPRPAQGQSIPDGSEFLEVLEVPRNIGDLNDSDELRADGEMHIADRVKESASVYTIPSNMVIAAATVKDRSFGTEVAAPTNEKSQQALIDYWTQVFSYDPPYLKKFIANIKETNFA